MDASKFFTTNAEEWYANMMECGDCGAETEAGTLADMIQWATEHSKVCEPTYWIMEELYNPGPYEYWSTDYKAMTDAQRAIEEAKPRRDDFKIRFVNRFEPNKENM